MSGPTERSNSIRTHDICQKNPVTDFEAKKLRQNRKIREIRFEMVFNQKQLYFTC